MCVFIFVCNFFSFLALNTKQHYWFRNLVYFLEMFVTICLLSTTVLLNLNIAKI